MNIVVLDGYTLNPGDLDWAPLRELGNCSIYDRTPPAAVAARAGEAELVLANKALVRREQLERLPHLRYVGVLATGYNNVDVNVARDRGVVVSNVPTYGTESVAQMTFALLLELALRTGHHAQTVREGRWSSSPDFCYWDHPLMELSGLVLGVVGFGRIGQAVARLAEAFGMHVLAHTPHPPQTGLGAVEFTSLDALLERSDVVTLHCPLTPETQHLIDAPRLSRMKNGAFLVNTSRGGLLDEAAVGVALRGGQLAGAALDVLAQEPPSPGHGLVQLPNCLVTPHIAWATRSARRRLLATAVENVKAFLAGSPRNVVNA